MKILLRQPVLLCGIEPNIFFSVRSLQFGIHVEIENYMRNEYGSVATKTSSIPLETRTFMNYGKNDMQI